MRRLLMVVGMLAVAGCSNVRDRFSNADMAAEAGSLNLSSERLAHLLTGAKGLRVTRDAAQFVGNVWVDYALFAQAAVDGKLPTDSAGMAEAMWPELAELRGNHWHDTLMARRSQITPATVDSLYAGDSVRVLQHILFGVQPTATPEVRSAQRKKAEATLGRLRRGADFGDVASELSDDTGSRQDRGYLPPSPRGRFVAAFDSAGWRLAPGAMTGIVETPFGYHIIKRPSADSVRERLGAYVAQTAGMRLDSIYMDSLSTRNKVAVAANAPAAMRSALQSPEAYRKSNTKLTTFKGGALTVSEYLRWVRALPPAYAAQLRQADDSMLGQFARVLTQNVLLLRQADSAKIQITPAEWEGLTQRYRTTVDTLRAEMGLRPDAVDSAAAKGERSKVAEMKVDAYFDRIVAGNAKLRPLPSALGMVLRERSRAKINEAGINRAVEIAEAEQKKTDSSRAGGAMTPAPGPAPVPGQAAPAPAPAPGADSGSAKGK